MVDVLLKRDPLQDGNGERSRLAGAGAGLANDIDLLERKGDQPRLNGRGLLIAGQIESVEHDVRQAEAIKRWGRGGAVLQQCSFQNS